VVASGKGGTGKTTVAASLAVFFANHGMKVFVADADVDAPDLLLSLGGGKTLSSIEIRSSEKARIDKGKCIGCNRCVEICPFGAIVASDSGRPTVVDLMCEGCGVCKLVCPADAIDINQTATGTFSIEETRYGFRCATGKLRLGEHNSGHLVATIKSIGRRKAQDAASDVFIVDAAPGIGCPVIASISGADYVIAVTEPTPAAKRNLERLSKVTKHFGVPTGVVLNRAGYSPKLEATIRDWVLCELKFQFLGEIPVDYEVVRALVQMKPVIDFNPDAKASMALSAIGNKVGEILW